MSSEENESESEEREGGAATHEAAEQAGRGAGEQLVAARE